MLRHLHQSWVQLHLDGSNSFYKRTNFKAPDSVAFAGQNATPLFVAAQEGHELVVHELLQSKSYPDTPRIDGATPLHAAAAGCHKGIIELLLGGNANLESADASNRAPVDLVKREK